MRVLWGYIAIILVLSTGCDRIKSWYNRLYQPSPAERQPIARVYDKYLYASDIQHLVGENINSQDSIRIIRKYVDNWVKENLVVHLAKQNLPEQKKDIERQMEDYRNSLLTFAYEQALIKEKMDTSVTKEQLRQYYQDNKDIFVLETPLIRLHYLQIAPGAPHIDSARIWMRSQGKEAKKSLKNYCLRFATRYSLNQEKWFRYKEIDDKLPLSESEPAVFFRQNTYIEKKDSSFLYLIRVFEYRKEGETAPFRYVKNDIYQTIINQRKRAFIEEMYQDIYKKAVKEKSFEVYL